MIQQLNTDINNLLN